MTIKAIVYDMDGMLFHEPHYFTEELEKKYSIPIEELLFSKDDNYDECKKGKISLNEFLEPYFKKWKKYPKFNKSLDEIKEEWFNFTKISKEMITLAKELKKRGIINIIITNNVRERIEFLNKKYMLSETFEIIGSPELGIMKPDPKFYEVLKEKFDLKLNEVLYYDDKEETINELKKYGFDAIVYKNLDQFKEDLKIKKIKFI